MSKTAQISVLTANRLSDGIVVFLDFEGAWNESLAEAVVARSPDEVKALEDRGVYDATRNIVVEPYLVEVREEAGRLTPLRYRERVRASGPSILADVPGYVSPSRLGVPSPLVGEGQGGGDGRTSNVGIPPTPNPSPRRVEDAPSARWEGEQGASGERESLSEAA